MRYIVGADLRKSVTPAEVGQQAFWRALPYARIDKGTNCLVLPAGVYFMGYPPDGSKLLYRKHYAALWQQANSYKQAGFGGFMVSGTPGIGKSWWLYVVLWEAAQRGWTVVLQHALCKSRFLFKGSTVQVGDSTNAFQEELQARETLYLVDGESPTLVAAWTIAVSFDTKHYWAYHKEPRVEIRYMPVWSEEELLDAQRNVYTHLNGELVKKLYQKWGGSARFCLQRTKDAGDRGTDLQRDIDAIDLKACIPAEWNLKIPSAMSDIFHLSVNDDYSSGEVVFASRYAQLSLMRALVERFPNQTRLFLAIVFREQTWY